MSANNQIVIRKTKKGWKIEHWNVECGKISNIGFAKNLEEAVKKAYKWEDECTKECGLFEVEYGIRVILKEEDEK